MQNTREVAREGIMIKCKQAIENLTYEVEQQKAINQDQGFKLEQYEQLVSQLQDENSNLSAHLNHLEVQLDARKQEIRDKDYELAVQSE